MLRERQTSEGNGFHRYRFIWIKRKCFQAGKSCIPKAKTAKLAASLLLIVAIQVFMLSGSALGVENYRFISMWPSLTGPWYFSAAQGVATDSSGNVYVADTGNNRVLKFNSSGALITKWGSLGTGDGQFSSPRDLAVDSSGNVYVVDTTNNRIQKFDSSGTFVTKWGATGAGNGQFNNPNGIAISSVGNVYVADSTNNRIQRFNTSGTYASQWGTVGTGNGQFSSPQAIAIDSSGYVYVADTTNNRVQKFNSTGTYQTKWGATGATDGLFTTPRGIGVDSSGNVYVVDAGNNRVQKFDSVGTFLTKWGSVGSLDGMFSGAYKLAVSPDGYIYVADSTNNRIQKFDNNGGFVAKWASLWWDDGMFNSPYKLAVSPSRYIYVTDTTNNRIERFNGSGVYMGKWGTTGSGNSQFNSPQGIATDATGSVYVADTSNNRIQKFDASGNYLMKFGSYGTGNGCFNSPQAVAIDSSGNIYVADTSNNRIEKFDSNGNYLTKWGAAGAGNGQFNAPRGIAVDSSGYVYVVDSTNNRVQKFDSIGTYVTQWGTTGAGNGQFNAPRSIAVDSQGDIYVADMTNNRIQKFDSGGGYLTKFGTVGPDNGQFLNPQGIAVDAYGNAYVADTGYHRIQRFSSESTSPNTTLTTNPSSPDGENGWFTGQPTITLTANEPVTTYYHWDDDTDTTYTVPFVAPTGEHTLSYHSADEVGNIELEKSSNFMVDETNPECSGTSPADNATDVTASDTITVSFSEDIAAGTSYNMISAVAADGSPVNIRKTISSNELLFNILSDSLDGKTLQLSIPSDGVTDPAGNSLTGDYDFSFTIKESTATSENTSGHRGSGGSGGGGGGASADNTGVVSPGIADEKLEKGLRKNSTTIAELPDLVRVAVPGNAIQNDSQVIDILKIDGSALNVTAPLISPVAKISLNSGSICGPFIISLNYDAAALQQNKKASICRIDEITGEITPLGGLVNEKSGTVSVAVSDVGNYAVTSINEEPGSLKNTYRDMSSHWAEKTVSKLAGMDILSGYTDNTFKPDSSLTRAELAVIMAKALKLDEKSPVVLTFEDNRDIPVWARNSISSLLGTGIINGTVHKGSAGYSFDPNRPVTRAEFAVIIQRVIRLKTGISSPLNDPAFGDIDSIPSWSKDAVNIAASMGIINGYPGNVFDAPNITNRAEAACMISRLLDLL
jgi:DNA-binding beta-propeller fold protein YncE